MRAIYTWRAEAAAESGEAQSQKGATVWRPSAAESLAAAAGSLGSSLKFGRCSADQPVAK